MKILGIETSCDETAAAVVEIDESDPGAGCKLLSNVVASSMDLHAQYGGVVPEIAARSHIESITPVINEALHQAKSGQIFGLDGAQGAAVERKESVHDSTARAQRKTATQRSTKSNSGVASLAGQQTVEAYGLWDEIDGIAVTYGAGLGGSLLVGVLTARTLALIKNKPLYAINHVEGHIYANFLTSTALPGYRLPKTQPAFPMLALIVSGGHTQLVLFKDHFDYVLLGQTRDDAIGEAFDKVAKILGLPYPGGPSVSEAAKEGSPLAFNFPKARSTLSQATHVDEVQGDNEKRASRTTGTASESRKQSTQQFATSASGISGEARKQAGAMRGLGTYDFSFSGLKTAVLRTAQKQCAVAYDFPSSGLSKLLKKGQKADLAASFQKIAIETVIDKTLLAFEEFGPASVVIAGGVAANQELRRQLSERLPIKIEYTDPKLCTDNGAMIAALGCYKALLKQIPTDPCNLDISPNLSM